MMAVRTRNLGLAVAGLSLSMQALAADRHPTIDTPHFISMFKAICLNHLDNQNAQIAAAETGPWKLAPKGTDEDGEARFRSDLVALGVSSDSTKGCSLTGAIDPALDVEKVQAEVISRLSLPPSKAMPSPDSRYWMIGIAGREDRYVITLKVKNYSGDNLVTLNSSKL